MEPNQSQNGLAQKWIGQNGIGQSRSLPRLCHILLCAHRGSVVAAILKIVSHLGHNVGDNQYFINNDVVQ